MPNNLTNENSPYLLQHANNPVDWYPWSEAALKKARDEDKPIFLSIGYTACHWCHVMAHESFEDIQIAGIMNEHFVNIKVDREERPDLDNIYMSAVVAITGSGGWPMSVFLTPKGEPFYAGTYFPPVRRHNLPSFTEILLTIARLWKDDRPRLLNTGKQITEHLIHSQSPPTQTGQLSHQALEIASKNLAQMYDWEYGGWGKAPKFPQPMAIEYLLHRGIKGDKQAKDITVHVLNEMAKGGMYDVIGGGFARYSTDHHWLVPHFEKMLYDNAQLAKVYLHAYLVSGDCVFKQVCEETLDFIMRELRDHSFGGFYSSLDADSENEEGKFYLWSPDEIKLTLSDAQLATTSNDIDWSEFFIAAYGVNDTGNFEGCMVLQRVRDDQDLANTYGLTKVQVRLMLNQMHTHLLEKRSKRVRPQTDDKVLVAWNGLALMAFSEAARFLKRTDYKEIAQKNAAFLIDNLYSINRLQRSWRLGKTKHDAFLEDHAALILGLISLYQTDADNRWYQAAIKLVYDMLTHFADTNGGFFDTRDDQEKLLFRSKDLQDNATPSGNALAAIALLQASIYEGNAGWRRIAENMLEHTQEVAVRFPTAFAQWLSSIEYALIPIQEVVLVGDRLHPAMQAFGDVLWSKYRPFTLVAQSSFPPDPTAPPILQARPLQNGLPTAYLCQDFTCKQPVTLAEELKIQLDQ